MQMLDAALVGAMECQNNSAKIDAFFTFFGSI
jgi:hypothetical protein